MLDGGFDGIVEGKLSLFAFLPSQVRRLIPLHGEHAGTARGLLSLHKDWGRGDRQAAAKFIYFPVIFCSL